jgi:hypothetical protein
VFIQVDMIVVGLEICGVYTGRYDSGKVRELGCLYR